VCGSFERNMRDFVLLRSKATEEDKTCVMAYRPIQTTRNLRADWAARPVRDAVVAGGRRVRGEGLGGMVCPELLLMAKSTYVLKELGPSELPKGGLTPEMLHGSFE
jgi:hypothetical protein